MTDICNTLRQRTALLQMIMPPVRYSGLENPYINTTYTPSMLDMRRKAEILQYNKSASQTNQPTRSQKFARAIGRNIRVDVAFIGTIAGTTLTFVSFVKNGIIEIGQTISGIGVIPGTIIVGKTGSTTYTINNAHSPSIATTIYANTAASLSTCASDMYLPSLSSSCDVPGPVVVLQYDPTVPLYNYASNIASLGFIDTTDTRQWTDSTRTDITAYKDMDTVLLNLAITNIDASQTTFSIDSPIGIYVDGNASGSGTVTLDGIDVSVYYNDRLFTAPIGPVITTLAELQSKVVQYTITGSGTKQFSGVKYIGNLRIVNLTLPTVNGYVYQIRVKFALSPTPLGTNTRVYMNVTPETTNALVNCIFTSPTDVSSRLPYSISSV